MNAKLIKENKELKAVNSSLTRNKIINESINHLPINKQEMVKKLVKDVPTNQLNESLKKYVSMVMEENTTKTINKPERVLRESKRLNFVSGSSEGKNTAMKNLVKDSSNLGEDLDREIESIIAMSKF